MAARIVIEDDILKIKEYLMGISDTISDYLDLNNESKYLMLRKNISHSDLITSGKRTKVSDPFKKNYLYYMTVEEMEELDKINKQTFATAHQSNINFPKKILYEFIGMEDPGNSEDVRVNMNDIINVYLVNDTLKYFTIDYTFKIFEKLNKVPDWDKNALKYDLDNTFTRIDLSIAAHGIGCSENEVFHKLRRSLFKSDEIILLMEYNQQKNIKNLYILLKKNPKFYSILGECDNTWEKYLQIQDKKQLYNLLKSNNLSENDKEKTRKNQRKWRKMLAEEMMSYTTVDDEVFCPLTYISGNFSSVGTLFRASHIKAFNECSIDEAFDLNNGILISANADALFDKHLITIDDDGNIIFSYLVKNEGPKFIAELKLNDKVFKAILNDKRKEYLKRHREIFYIKEDLRKKGNCVDLDSSDEEQL